MGTLSISHSDDALSIVVVGASGDLARGKIYPALFSLFCQGFLPERLHIFGFARSPMDSESFRRLVEERLTCRYTPEHDCPRKTREFLSRCFYVAGEYDSPDAFLNLYATMKAMPDGGAETVRVVYYMAIPPFLFLPVARSIGDAGLVTCAPASRWPRAVIEKPFGRDRRSSDELVRCMGNIFTEEQTFRIDHYLGKEAIQNLLVLRFANRVFAPIWSNEAIESVRICWKEDIGVGDRGGYFDEYGIIRDVMQNHLLQILALLSMGRPASLEASDIRDAKVDVLKQIAPVKADNFLLGQYTRGEGPHAGHPGYLEESSVPSGSITPTFAATVLHVDSPEWQGVPFLIAAGKAVEQRITEVRIRLKPLVESPFYHLGEGLRPNELVVRVQPDEAIAVRLMNKLPGLGMELRETELNLRYKTAYEAVIPDAYEALLLDVIQGDRSLFIRADELAAAWDIFTPALDEMEHRGMRPQPYPFGSGGPPGLAELASRFGFAL